MLATPFWVWNPSICNFLLSREPNREVTKKVRCSRFGCTVSLYKKVRNTMDGVSVKQLKIRDKGVVGSGCFLRKAFQIVEIHPA